MRRGRSPRSLGPSAQRCPRVAVNQLAQQQFDLCGAEYGLTEPLEHSPCAPGGSAASAEPCPGSHLSWGSLGSLHHTPGTATTWCLWEHRGCGAPFGLKLTVVGHGLAPRRDPGARWPGGAGGLGLLAPNLPGPPRKEGLSQCLGQARGGSRREVLCPPAAFAGGWMLARRDGWEVGWGGLCWIFGWRRFPIAMLGNGWARWAAACPVHLHSKGSHRWRPGLPAFRSGAGRKVRLVRAERKGWELRQSLVSPGQPRAGLFGFGLHWQQRVLPGEWLGSP